MMDSKREGAVVQRLKAAIDRVCDLGGDAITRPQYNVPGGLDRLDQDRDAAEMAMNQVFAEYQEFLGEKKRIRS